MAFRDDLRSFAGQAQRQLEQGAQQVQDRMEEYRPKHGGVDETAVARICAQMAAVEAEMADGRGDRPGRA
jgi:hypothetical protein